MVYKNTDKKSNQEDNFLKISLVNQGVFFRKKKTCPLKSIPLSEISYKNTNLLIKFISERGKIISNRITGVSIKKQKAVARAIKIARQLALMSPISNESKN